MASWPERQRNSPTRVRAVDSGVKIIIICFTEQNDLITLQSIILAFTGGEKIKTSLKFNITIMTLSGVSLSVLIYSWNCHTNTLICLSKRDHEVRTRPGPELLVQPCLLLALPVTASVYFQLRVSEQRFPPVVL